MLIILEIIGAIICLNCVFRLLVGVGAYAGLKGANKLTAKGEQVEINNANLAKAVNTIKLNTIMLVIGAILIFLGENFSH